MRIGAIMTAIVGLAVAGGSTWFARDVLESRVAQPAAEAEVSLVEVYVAGQDIGFGQVIEANMLTTIAWPSNAVPIGTFSDAGDLLPKGDQDARRARRPIAQGELILVSKVSDFGEKVTIVQTLGPNNRAMAIKVNAESGVGGFVTPGDFVDVLLTQGRNENMRAVTILQNIRVVGVDQDSNEQTDAPEVARTVTVEVTPDQGQRLALAQKAGTLSLTLRTLDGAVDEPLESVRLSDLMRDISPVPEEEEAKVIRTILVRRGTAEEVEELR
ncbi:Flp pilus assembly protein CpaB [Aliiroseovarius sp.]|uniref:Flp pilus assembly protein CpaB n=1 Tax=Aliiroseovarius sp. TaxID=1872442 RepID=UPI002608CAF7|nr:Flp pilus assembly protein CpaB [Aliiroseovarius sp.]